jgi:hypothetical protein
LNPEYGQLFLRVNWIGDCMAFEIERRDGQ